MYEMCYTNKLALPCLALPCLALPCLALHRTHRTYTWLTHTESFAEWQKAGAGCTSCAFKLPGHDFTRTWCLAVNLTDYTYDSELISLMAFPIAFDAARVPEGEIVLHVSVCYSHPADKKIVLRMFCLRTHLVMKKIFLIFSEQTKCLMF